MLSKEEIIDYFKLENSHAKKELGQNFLISQNVINNIIDCLKIDSKDSILEIGPGLGALTNEIYKKLDNYVVVEYDAKFCDFLSRAYSDLDIRKQNILKFKEDKFNKIVGNLPYYITSDIFMHLALNFKNMKTGIFMIQKEAYKRITSKKGTKEYNVLNIILDYVFTVKQKFIVGRNNFFPIPNVESVVVSFERKTNIDENIVMPLLKTTRALFLNRRKTIFNNLNSLIKSKDKTLEILNSLGYKENIRSETLDIEDFLKITKLLLKEQIIKL